MKPINLVCVILLYASLLPLVVRSDCDTLASVFGLEVPDAAVAAANGNKSHLDVGTRRWGALKHILSNHSNSFDRVMIRYEYSDTLFSVVAIRGTSIELAFVQFDDEGRPQVLETFLQCDSLHELDVLNANRTRWLANSIRAHLNRDVPDDDIELLVRSVADLNHIDQSFDAFKNAITSPEGAPPKNLYIFTDSTEPDIVGLSFTEGAARISMLFFRGASGGIETAVAVGM